MNEIRVTDHSRKKSPVWEGGHGPSCEDWGVTPLGVAPEGASTWGSFSSASPPLPSPTLHRPPQGPASLLTAVKLLRPQTRTCVEAGPLPGVWSAPRPPVLSQGGAADPWDPRSRSHQPGP